MNLRSGTRKGSGRYQQTGSTQEREESAEHLGLPSLEETRTERHEHVHEQEPEEVPPPPAVAAEEAPVPPTFERLVNAFLTAVEGRPARARTITGDDRDATLSHIKGLGAETFDGTGTPAEADAWLKRLEKVFRLSGCTDRRKVDYAIFLLEKEAENWWDTQSLNYEYPEDLTWNEFKEDFRRHYVPDSYQTKKINEFFNLRQGSRSVDELDRQFRSLSRYVPGMTNNDRVMRDRFLEALNEDIKYGVAGTNWGSYAELVQAAIRIEEVVPRRSKGDKNSMRRPREQFQTSADRAPKKFNAGHGAVGTRARPEIRCFTCGRAGHLARDCRGKAPTCHACGREGHVSWNCPRRGQQRNEQQGGASGRNAPAMTCYTCGAVGHISPQCPNRIQQGGAGRGQGAGPTAAPGNAAPRNAPPAAGRGAPGNGRGRGGRGQPAAQGRVYAMTQTDALATPEVVEGKI